MAENPIRLAAPTAATPVKDNGPSEGRADPHGIHWMRGAPPIDCKIYSSGDTYPADLVAASVTRKSDDSGASTGNGRRASGLLALDGGTVVFITGAGNSVTAALAAGQGFDIEMTTLTSWSGTQLLVFW